MPETLICDKIRTKGRVIDLNSKPNGSNDQWLLKAVYRAIQQDEAGVHIEDPVRKNQLKTCAAEMKRIFGKTAERIEVTPHTEFPSCGEIFVYTREFSVDDPAAFVKAAELASNYEIYAQLDGTIVLAFAFYGMTKKVGGIE